jgi:hypothetical protein
MWRLDVSSEAELEIFAAALRYERERDGLGFRFEAQATEKTDARTEGFPRLCSCRSDESPSSKSFRALPTMLIQCLHAYRSDSSRSLWESSV